MAGAIHIAGALTGVHCEANTDWSLLMEADLDMTTFINLMVVLLAFLLVTSAFTELSQLQVNLPSGGGGGGANAPKPLVLEVSIYKDKFVVADRQSGPIWGAAHPPPTGRCRCSRGPRPLPERS